MEVVKPGHNMVSGHFRHLLAAPGCLGVVSVLRTTQPEDPAHLPAAPGDGAGLLVEFCVRTPYPLYSLPKGNQRLTNAEKQASPS